MACGFQFRGSSVVFRNLALVIEVVVPPEIS
jgi:hypothetical protein